MGSETGVTPMMVAKQLASMKFKDQMEKVGLGLSYIREARLSITKLPGHKNGYVNGHLSTGFEASFIVRAMLQQGKTYERQKSVFVAPDDPKFERRSMGGA